MKREPATNDRRSQTSELTREYARFIEVLAVLELPPARVQVFDAEHPWFDASRPLLVLPTQFEGARAALANRYPVGP